MGVNEATGGRLRPTRDLLIHKSQLGCCVVLVATLAACGKDPEQIKTVQSLTRRLAEIAGQANQAAPANIDADTRLDGARAGPGLKLTSVYTLVNAAANGIDATTFGAKLAPVVRSASCDNPELRPLIDQGVIVVLEYRGKEGDSIGTVTVDRNTCAVPPPGTAHN